MHKISTESEFSPNDLMLKTKSGKNYFIRQYIKMGVFVGGANLEVVDEADGNVFLILIYLDFTVPPLTLTFSSFIKRVQ